MRDPGPVEMGPSSSSWAIGPAELRDVPRLVELINAAYASSEGDLCEPPGAAAAAAAAHFHRARRPPV